MGGGLKEVVRDGLEYNSHAACAVAVFGPQHDQSDEL